MKTFGKALLGILGVVLLFLFMPLIVGGLSVLFGALSAIALPIGVLMVIFLPIVLIGVVIGIRAAKKDK